MSVHDCVCMCGQTGEQLLGVSSPLISTWILGTECRSLDEWQAPLCHLAGSALLLYTGKGARSRGAGCPRSVCGRETMESVYSACSGVLYLRTEEGVQNLLTTHSPGTIF